MQKRILSSLLALCLCGVSVSSASPALPDGLKVLGEEALCGVPLEGLVLPDGLETIGSRAFAGSGLKWVSIPDSVTEIAEDAFRDTGGSLLILASADSAAARAAALQPPETNTRLYTGAAGIRYRWKEKLAVGLEFDLDPVVTPAGRDVIFASGTASAEVSPGEHVRIVDEGTVAITFTDHEGEHVLVSQDVLPVFYFHEAPGTENEGNSLVFSDRDAVGLWQCPGTGVFPDIRTEETGPVSPSEWPDGRLFVNVAGDCAWTALVTDGSEWITLLRNGGGEKSIDPGSVYHANLNRTGAPREGRVRFSAGKFAYDLVIRQEVPEEIVSVAGVRLDCASRLAPEGGAFRLTAAVLPEAATDRFLTWESSNPAVASVKDGEVTALRSGTAVISARSADGEKTASCAVTVCPDDGTVCLVCMGYKLNADGSMQPELIGRLKTLLSVAGIFPNATIVCTGGATASGNAGATEAGQMANWLRAKGIASGRILAERDSRTTAENAVNTLELLHWRRPRTAWIVIVTSDYHMREAVNLFKSAAAGTNPRIVVVAGEAWQTGSPIPPSGGR